MLKKTITYKDYEDNSRTEDFYFNLTEAELLEMQWGTDGGFTNKLQRIMDKQDVPEIMKVFKELIMKSYGEKSPDGRRFIKSQELSEAFAQTEAYSILFMEIMSGGPDAASAFVNGIVPQNIAAEAAKQQTNSSPKLLGD